MENGLYEEHFASDERFGGVKYSKRSGGRTSPSHSAHGNLFRHSLMKHTDDKRARKVRFYRNGDRFFKGIVYAVSAERFRTFESLMAELTSSPVCDKNILPNGVRYIFSAENGHKIHSLDELEEGESYVCASTDVFKNLDYTCMQGPHWNVNNKARESGPLLGRLQGAESDFKDYVKPKLVTVIRNGPKPRKAVRVLLNKKTAHSFDQVLADITEAIKLDSGAVRKIFTLDGRQVSSLKDFFGDDSVFIAYGQEKLSQDDFDLDDNEVKLVSPYKPIPFTERVTLRSAKTSRPASKLSLSNRSLNEDVMSKRSPTGSKSPMSSPRSGRKLRAVSAPKYRNSNGEMSDESENGPAALRAKYDIGRVIGEGNFAVVKECQDRNTRKKYALKKIDKQRCKGKEHIIENEVSILRQVDHPNIILLIEEFDTRDSLYLVMEFVKGGDLFDDIALSTKYTERTASNMINNLAQALKYLHNLRIVHRDVKPENLLIIDHADGSKSLKLGDFGLATYCEDQLFTVCGTPTYVAPEILSEIGYDFKVDVWAAGVILYILLCGFPPFASPQNDQEELFDQISEGRYEFTSPYWDEVSESAMDLISNMLVVDPADRMSAVDVLGHPWVTAETVKDEELSVGENIRNFSRRDKPSRSRAGIRLVASTPLDHPSRYFQGRRAGLTVTKHQSNTEDDDEIF
ncbi:serine/threonine-protein kinase DCLK1-like isoform X1 [Saccostrea echinata]|uniref:serine/threonine-protein kinase DCLK1-like isoform X1 n=1 Tax=Saccostrea echinata TaxID=191078 RepID=UPI002A8054EE|nr:serine/threonine-protein kinase DCLK1-like isoform X1 [Saccostrea echinata]XP_061165271.1 serine/threonine-protein kinase DCLK1-like isoform X1 [Saccostrea echinata]